MIKNIIFDMGNVILRFDPEIFLTKFVADETARPLIHKAIFDRPEWNLLDKGTITEDEILQKALSELPPETHDAARNVMEHWHEELPLIDETYHLATELKKAGYFMYLLSNAGLRFHEYSQNVPIFKLFDGIIVSADYLSIKPEPKLYNILFNKFNLNPSECLFIDDLKANIEGGKACGMDGIVFDGDMIKLRNAMLKKGVRLDPEVAFSPVEQADIPQLAHIADEVWNQHFTPIIGKAQVDYMLDKFQSVQALTEQILEHGYKYYFLCYNGEKVGYTGFKLEDNSLFLSKIYLKQAYRGKKIAKKAMEFLVSTAKNNRCEKIWLTVNRGNDGSINFYKAIGFDITREQKADIGNGFVMDDYIMELSLR